MYITFDEMPDELKALYEEYFDIFNRYPDEHAELDGQCPEAFDAKLIAEAIKKRKSLPRIILGDDLHKNQKEFLRGLRERAANTDKAY